MGKPLCNACQEGKQCTGWACDDDDWKLYVRCPGANTTVWISSDGSAIPDRHKDTS